MARMKPKKVKASTGRPPSAGAGPSWKPAKLSGSNYGKAVSAAAKAKSSAPTAAAASSTSSPGKSASRGGLAPAKATSAGVAPQALGKKPNIARPPIKPARSGVRTP